MIWRVLFLLPTWSSTDRRLSPTFAKKIYILCVHAFGKYRHVTFMRFFFSYGVGSEIFGMMIETFLATSQVMVLSFVMMMYSDVY